MNAETLLSFTFKQALNDYYYLMNNHYPEKGSLKLVGDRYRLSTELRTILYRGICPKKEATNRKHRIIKSPSEILAIDGYNVLFTLLNYRLGRFVFISNDGICRDAGSLFGKIRKESLFNECADLLISYLSNYKLSAIKIYLDSPVYLSNKHRNLLHKKANGYEINMDIILTKSADQQILQHTSGALATSDSVIIDNSENPILDIPRTIIEEKYNYTIIKLETLLN